MVKAINTYKIHFNCNIGNDINYRSFETIGCKTVLATNYDKQYLDLGFIDGENCLLYKNEDDLIYKLKNTLNNDNLMDILSSNGYELSKKHTYEIRMKYLIKYLNDKGII